MPDQDATMLLSALRKWRAVTRLDGAALSIVFSHSFVAIGAFVSNTMLA